jgi:tRNA threonylcarbamoyladenosine biosynthesis protein TsaE
MTRDITLALADEQATLHEGGRFADSLEAGLTIYLHGDLGAGKTTLTRGLLRRLGHEGKVKSTTYTLVEPYEIQLNQQSIQVYHFDLYRFIDEEEWDAAGFRDYFNSHSICIVEWPEKAGSLIPQADIDVFIEVEGAGRIIQYIANSSVGKKCLEQF